MPNTKRVAELVVGDVIVKPHTNITATVESVRRLAMGDPGGARKARVVRYIDGSASLYAATRAVRIAPPVKADPNAYTPGGHVAAVKHSTRTGDQSAPKPAAPVKRGLRHADVTTPAPAGYVFAGVKHSSRTAV